MSTIASDRADRGRTGEPGSGRSRPRNRLARACVGSIALIAALAPAAAHGAVTLGSDHANSASFGAPCGPGDCTVVQTALPGRPLTSPISGVVVGWRVRESVGTFRLRVLRAAGPGIWTAIASSEPGAVPAPVPASFPTRLPIQAGDTIGLDLLGGAALGVRVGVAGAAEADFFPVIGDGETRGPHTVILNGENMFNADIEADADADGFGDESQDACPTDRSTQGACTSDMSIALSALPRRLRAGSLITYRLTVSNPSPNAVAGVRATIGLGAVTGIRTTGVTSATGAPAGSCRAVRRGTVSCNFGTLAARSSARVTVTARAAQRGLLRAAAQFTARSLADPNAANDTARRTITVTRPAQTTN